MYLAGHPPSCSLSRTLSKALKAGKKLEHCQSFLQWCVGNTYIFENSAVESKHGGDWVRTYQLSATTPCNEVFKQIYTLPRRGEGISVRHLPEYAGTCK